MSSGTGMADDLVEEVLTEFDLALPQRAFVGPLGVPPEFRAAGDHGVHRGLSALILVDQRDVGVEQAVHLVSEPGLNASASTAVVVNTERSHEVG